MLLSLSTVLLTGCESGILPVTPPPTEPTPTSTPTPTPTAEPSPPSEDPVPTPAPTPLPPPPPTEPVPATWSRAGGDCDVVSSFVRGRPDDTLVVAFPGNSYYPGWGTYETLAPHSGEVLGSFSEEFDPSLWEFQDIPEWGVGVGDVLGTGQPVDAVRMAYHTGPLRLLTAPRPYAGLVDGHVMDLPFGATEAIFCGDVSGDGSDDLCTDVGIDRNPVDGVLDTAWGESAEQMFRADGWQHPLLGLFGGDLVELQGDAVGAIDLLSARHVSSDVQVATVGDWDGDSVDDLVLLKTSGLSRVVPASHASFSETPLLSTVYTADVVGLAVARLLQGVDALQLVLVSPDAVRVVDADGLQLAHWAVPSFYSEFQHAMVFPSRPAGGPDTLILVGENCSDTMILAVVGGIP